MIAATPIELAVSPPRLVVAAGETRTISVTNLAAAGADVTAAAKGYRITLRGRPILLAATSTVAVRPRAFRLGAGETATLAVTAPSRPAPGDHPAIVLVSRRLGAMRVRLGVLVLVRGSGRIVHRIVVTRRRRLGRTLEVWLRNEGNVSERLTRASIPIRLPCRFRVEPRELLPHSRGILLVHAACAVVPRRARAPAPGGSSSPSTSTRG